MLTPRVELPTLIRSSAGFHCFASPMTRVTFLESDKDGDVFYGEVGVVFWWLG